MALGDYLSSLNLDAVSRERLASMAGDTGDDPGRPVSQEEADHYGAMAATSGASLHPSSAATFGPPTAEQVRKSLAATQPAKAGADAANPSNPASDGKWDPAEEKARTAAFERQQVLDAATPQGPAGPDGFPTYRDLSGGAGGVAAAPGGPARTVAAHWQPGTRSESHQYGMNPDELVDGQYHRDVGAGHSLMAGEKHLEAAQQQGMADAVYAAAHTKASQDAAAQMQKLQVQREQYVQQEQSKLNDMAIAAQKQVDPEAAKGSSGAQLMAAIGIAMGQYGASITGGPNAALQIVNANIDRNIAAQQANIANAGKAHDREASLYRQNLEAFGDKERATLATKVAYLDQAKGMADQQYALAKNTANEGQYHAFVASVEDQRAKAVDDFAKLTHTQVATQGNEHYVPTQTVGGAGAGQKGKEKLYVPGLGGYARDEETARKLNAHGALRTQINEDLHEIHLLLETSKGLNSVSDYGEMQKVRQRIDQLKHGVLQKTTVLADQGAMSNGDKAVAEARSGLESVDPRLRTDAEIKRMQAGLANVAKGHQRDARLEGESYGIQLGREGYTQGPSGPEARAELTGRNKVVTKKTEGVDDLIEKPKGKPVE